LAGAFRCYLHRELRWFEAVWVGAAAFAWFIPRLPFTPIALGMTALYYARELLVRRTRMGKPVRSP
jgi:hypothetical protein